jgi:hypothetical protein
VASSLGQAPRYPDLAHSWKYVDKGAPGPLGSQLVLCYVGAGGGGLRRSDSGVLSGVVSLLLLVRSSWILGQNGMVETKRFRCEKEIDPVDGTD